jgi:enterochelin esterase family protein
VRIGDTDLWVGLAELPKASRTEYRILVDGDQWLTDPANPATQWSGLTGENSLLVMPGFTVTDDGLARRAAPAGALSDDQSITSEVLGYAVNYRVYTPPGYAALDSLPVVYLLDGNDFADERMGAMVIVLDNVIGTGRVRPVLAVFIDSRDPNDPGINRREDEFLARPEEHARFIADELVPAIDARYRTDRQPESRAIVGVSYGGASAMYIAATRSDVFRDLAGMSPSLWVLSSPQYLTDPLKAAGSQLMGAAITEAAACGEDTGYACPRMPLRVFLTAGIPDWDVGDLSGFVAGMKDQGYPVQLHQVREGHSWAQRRGLSDEMLEYFFAPGAGS